LAPINDAKKQSLVSSGMTVTVERLENAITMTAYVMAHHNLPQLLPTLKRLEAERDRLLQEGDPIEYAKRVLQQGTVTAIAQRRLAA
jgi:hypothetical protein